MSSTKYNLLRGPMFLTKNSTKDFQFLLNRLESRMNGWKSKSLSWADRYTMIKSVAQALPTYTMSTFELQSTIYDKLGATVRRFCWNPTKPTGKYLAWKSWDYLCNPKSKGGLGFKKAKNFNTALLAKLAWMVATKRDSMCMQILRRKYKIRGDWLLKGLAKNASPVWKAKERAKKIIVKCVCYLVGDGSLINV